MKLKVPTVHLNGTSKDDLVERLTEAHQMLTKGLNKLANAGPNGRDFYPQGDGAIDRAVFEHQLRMNRVQSVLDELEFLYNKIDEQ